MENQLTITMISSITAIVIAVISLFSENLKYLFKKKYNIKKIISFNKEIYEQLYLLLDSLKADRVSICRLHNGEHYKTGFPVEKFSMDFEVISENTDAHIAGRTQGVNIGRFAGMFYQLFYSSKNRFVAKFTEVKDVDFKDFLKKYDTNTIAIFLIKNGNTPLAFLTASYSKEVDFDFNKITECKNTVKNVKNLLLLNNLDKKPKL